MLTEDDMNNFIITQLIKSRSEMISNSDKNLIKKLYEQYKGIDIPNIIAMEFMELEMAKNIINVIIICIYYQTY